MRSVNSFNHAISGIVESFKLEKNMRIHFTVAVIVIVAAGLPSIMNSFVLPRMSLQALFL